MDRANLKACTGASICALTLLYSTSIAAAPPADPDAEGQQLEEVIVTATKRSESIMVVPVSISAVTAEDIDRLGAKNLEDLSRTVPALVVQQQDEQNDKHFSIRGIGSQSDASTVAVYVDDTPVTFGNFSPDLKLFDVERIEVLRGPQGTLFGSSSMGGAVRYVSRQPRFDEYSGDLKVEGGKISGGSESYEAQGAAGGPIVADRHAFRASAFTRRDGGYINLVDENSGAVTRHDINTVDSYGGRFALSGKLTDRVELAFSTILQKQEWDYLPTFFSGRGVTTTIPLAPEQRVDRTNVFHNDRVVLPSLTLKADLGFADLSANSSYVNRRVDLQADFSYFVQAALGIPDGGPSLVVTDQEKRVFKAYIEEVRLASKPDAGPLEWLVGAYHSSTKEPSQQLDPSNLGDLIPPLAPLLLENGGLFVQHTTVRRKQQAAFGEASYTVAEKLKLTAGLRLTRLNIDIDRAADGLFNGGFSTVDINSKEKPVTPKFSASYFLSPRAMVYATAAKGFREGGPNAPVPLGLPQCVAALAALGLTDAPSSFRSDSVWSYEVGAKGRSSDGRMRMTAAAYYIDWSGIQQTINLSGGCGFDYTDNIGQASSKGAEAEAYWRPLDNLSLNLNVAYTDAKLTKDLITGADTAGPIVAASKGTRLPDVPRWTTATAAQYDFALSPDLKAYVRADYQYIGAMKRDLGTPTDDPRSHSRDSFSVVNLRLALLQGRYEYALFVNNLLDKDTVLYRSFQNFAPGTASELTIQPPRIVGVSIRASF
jgi:outer membrane receptor protein involved in Fe transport